MPSTLAKTKTGIGSQAKIWNDNGHFMVQLHSTVVYDENNLIVKLNNGGWITQTTARYMTQALRHRNIDGYVAIRKGVMVYGAQGIDEKPFDGNTFVIPLIKAVA